MDTITAKLRQLLCASILLVCTSAIAQTNCASQPSGLVNWWQGENNAVDSVGGHNGTTSSGVSYITGEVAKGFGFLNGTLNLGTTTANFGTGNFTVEFWMKTSAAVAENYQIAVMEKRPNCNATTSYWGMRMGGNGTGGKLHFDMSANGSADAQSFIATKMINYGSWHHVALTRSNATISVYLDGAFDNSATGANTTFVSNTAPFTVGQSICSCCDGTQVFSGGIDELAIYNRPLSASEVLGIFNAGAYGKCGGSAPEITQQPASLTAQTNSLVGFSVSVTGSAPLSFQWSFNSSTISGATNSNLNIANVQLTNAGSYSVLITNAFGSAQSSNATLTVTTGDGGTAPVITQNPVSQTAQTNSTVGFSVVATGTAPLLYQWSFNSGAISGATGSSLTLANVQLSNAGSYSVFVTNAFGSAQSTNAILTVTGGGASTNCSGIAGLVNWWRGENNALDSIGTNNGTISGGTTYAAGEVGQTFQLSGSGGVTMDASVGNFRTNDFTVEFWMKTASTTPAILVGKRQVCNLGPAWNVMIGYINGASNPGKIGYELLSSAGDYSSVVTNFSVNDNQWHHIALTRAGTNGSMYVDGALRTTNSFFPSSTIDFNNTSPLQIGLSPCQGPGGLAPYTGSLDELAIFNRALTAAEIQSIYNAGSAGKCGLTGPPTITSQPTNIFAAVGSTVNVGVGAAGLQPLGYNWYFNGVNAYSTASSPLVITNVQLTNAGTYYVVVTNANGSVTSSNATLTVGVPPGITAQPQSQTSLQFQPVTFNANMSGSGPLAFQWQRNAASIAQATNSTYTIASVLTTDAASYRVVVTNQFGSLTSSNAVLSVFKPNVRLENGAITIGPVTVPLRMVAGGSENSVSVSVNFPYTNLLYSSTVLGSNAVGALLTINTNQLSSGKLGLGVFFADSSNFGIGTQELARITFYPGIVTNAVTNALTFVDVPTVRQVLDTNFNTLVTTYSNAVVTMPVTDLEGDVSPRTNGNRAMNIGDWTQTGRFVAGLDVVSNTLEFLRADSAPRTNGGDGRLSIADWVQAGRYALGFDPMIAIGGPTNFTVAQTPKLPSRPVSLVALSQNGVTNIVAVHLNAQGDENGIGFSLSYDPAQLSFVGAGLGSGAGGAVLNVNSSQAASGHVGIALAAGPGNSFAAGDSEVARVTFVSSSYGLYAATLGFADQPILREIADANATTESATYAGLTLNATGQPLPILTASLQDTNIVLSWNAPATGFNLESATPLGTNWNAVSYTPVTNGSSIVVTQGISADQTFFRLHHP
ncbi:MAG: cell wall/surface repeat protein [Verrucomicrobiales bacterium]|nr:cell wall/surface repeat protein [Verrucomicrobiales bacterium]